MEKPVEEMVAEAKADILILAQQVGQLENLVKAMENRETVVRQKLERLLSRPAVRRR